MNEYVNAIYNQRNPNALKELLEKKKKDLDEALLTVITDMDMATDEKVKFSRMLLGDGADPNVAEYPNEPDVQLPILHHTVTNNDLKLTDLIREYEVDINSVDNCGQTALHLSARDGLVDLARDLLADGADPNIEDEYGDIPLFLALKKKNTEMVELLIEHSDLNLRSGRNALTAIWFYRNPFAAQYLTRLLDLGLDKEAVAKEGQTVLCEAIMKFNYDCLEICINAGCNVNAKNRYGETILNHLLGIVNPVEVEERKKACISLINAGADVNLPNKDGLTPLELAVGNRNIPVLTELLQANCIVKTTRSTMTANDFMCYAVYTNAEDSAIFIFGDSCSAAKQAFFYKLSNEPDAMYNGKTVGLCKPLISLYRLCRVVVRSSLSSGPSFLTALDQLPLPCHVKDFVALR